MHRIESKLLQSKFRGKKVFLQKKKVKIHNEKNKIVLGVMLGVLAGDCCGLPFEFDGNLQPAVIRANLNRLEGPHFQVNFYDDIKK